MLSVFIRVHLWLNSKGVSLVQTPALLALFADAVSRAGLHRQRHARCGHAHRGQQRHGRLQHQAPQPAAWPALRRGRRGLRLRRHARLRRQDGAHPFRPLSERPDRGDDADLRNLRHAPIQLARHADDAHHPGHRHSAGGPHTSRRLCGVPRGPQESAPRRFHSQHRCIRSLPGKPPLPRLDDARLQCGRPWPGRQTAAGAAAVARRRHAGLHYPWSRDGPLPREGGTRPY